MNIWVDADSCPVPVRELIIKAARRLSVKAIFVSNKAISVPASELITCVEVPNGADVADTYINDNAAAEDLVITHDVPLIALLVARSIAVISPRGDYYNADNIGEIVATRNLLHDLRATGHVTKGPAPYDESHRRQFANALDKSLQKLLRSQR